MPIRAKICGLVEPKAVDAALAGGAAMLGFYFLARSPRAVRVETAAHLAKSVRGQARVVAVTVDPDDALVDEIAEILKPDLIQLHGQETPARAMAIKMRTGLGIIKVISVAEPLDINRARAFDEWADHLMFDAKTPKDAALPGGMGVRFDWDMLRNLRFSRPWLLAGGLDPWNVADAISRSGAPLVDVSSGVERGLGLKDPALISAFLDAVRKA